MNKTTVISEDIPFPYNVQSDSKTDFIKELSNARPADISQINSMTKKNVIKKVFSKIIKYIIMLLCLLIFIGAAAYVASYYIQYIEKQQQNTFITNLAEGKIKTKYAEMSTQNTGNNGTLTLGQSMENIDIGQVKIDHSDAYNEYFEKKRAGFIGLQRMYPDVFGWIDIPGTTIDYIIMQGKTNNDYLYTEYNGKYTRYGSIFADWRNSRSLLDNRNTIIYGHNMNTAGIMFSPLINFVTDEDAFRKQHINIIMPDGVYTYELFSIYETHPSYNYIETYFSSDEKFLDFCSECKRLSIYKKNVELTKDSRILTLSTCTVRGDGMRWALHAVLIGISN